MKEEPGAENEPNQSNTPQKMPEKLTWEKVGKTEGILTLSTQVARIDPAVLAGNQAALRKKTLAAQRKAKYYEVSKEKRAAKRAAKQKPCSVEGCNTGAHSRGLCQKHGNPCREESCEKQAVSGGLCRAHGGGGNRKPCSVDGCSALAQVRGLCKKHGNPCREEGCEKVAVSSGLCIAHGGGGNRKPCSVDGCSTLSASRGLCQKHGNP